MRTTEEYNKILAFNSDGLNVSQISKQLNIPRTTVRDIVKPTYVKLYPDKSFRFNHEQNNLLLDRIKNPISNEDEIMRKNYSYLLGMFLGDGCLTKDKKNVYRIRVTCDAKYPNIIDLVFNSVQTAMPNNKAYKVYRYYKDKLSCVDVSCYSKDWVLLFPFYQKGRKWTYKIALEKWQQDIIDLYAKDFWLGLYHSDGCRYIAKKKYVYYNFTQKSNDIFNLFLNTSNTLGVTCSAYKKLGVYNIAAITNKETVNFVDSFAGPKT
jgi:intein-encoded DNA endonuclease-like protein